MGAAPAPQRDLPRKLLQPKGKTAFCGREDQTLLWVLCTGWNTHRESKKNRRKCNSARRWKRSRVTDYVRTLPSSVNLDKSHGSFPLSSVFSAVKWELAWGLGWAGIRKYKKGTGSCDDPVPKSQRGLNEYLVRHENLLGQTVLALLFRWHVWETDCLWLSQYRIYHNLSCSHIVSESLAVTMSSLFQ